MSLFLKHFFDVDKPLFVTEFGSSSYNESKKVGPWSREMYILHFVVRGEAFFSGFTVQEGEAFLISKERLHSFTTSAEYEHYWIGFDGEAVATLFGAFKLENSTHQMFFVENINFIKTLFSSTCEALKSENPDNAEALVLSTLLAIMPLLSTIKQSKTSKKINYAEKVSAYIKSNYMYPLRMSNIAKEIYLSEKYMYRLFLERYNISPKQFLIKTRMEKAHELLQKNNLTVTEVSKAVGYDSISVFSKTFTNYFGVSPSSSRKQR